MDKELNQYLAAQLADEENEHADTREAWAQEVALLRAELDGLRNLRVEDYALLDEAHARTHAAEDALRRAEAKLARGLDVLAHHEPNTGDEADLMSLIRAALKGGD